MIGVAEASRAGREYSKVVPNTIQTTFLYLVTFLYFLISVIFAMLLLVLKP